MNFIEQLFGAGVYLLAIIWGVITLFHTLSFPLSEEKMREIIREEVKKLIVESEE